MIELPEGSVLAAVSGGADSVAMLRMLADAGRTLAVAHYNHGLRDEAGEDEAFVKSLCGQWDLPFASERGNVPKGAGVEAAAREMRYAFLERVRAERGLDCIATAHTADDNAETVLLNLTRGAGLPGLCGIPYRRGRIVRPLLRVTREEILRYLSEREIPYREDASNRDTVYRRNFIRHQVIPALKKVNPSLTDAVTRLTDSLGEDEAYLAGLAREEISRPRGDGGFPAKRLLELPRPVAARVCRLLIQAAGPYPPERVHLEAMLNVAAGGNGRRRNLAGNLTVEKSRGNIHIFFTNRKGVAVMHQDLETILLTEEQIAARVRALGAEISRDYKGKDLLLISVLKGSVVFMADLMRAVTVPAGIDFLSVSSYGMGDKTSGVVRIVKDMDQSVEGKDILIVEDILDSGMTLSYIMNLMETRNPTSIELCTLLDKPERRAKGVDVSCRYTGFTIPDAFVVGYGLDYAERYRNLPYIGVLAPRVYS